MTDREKAEARAIAFAAKMQAECVNPLPIGCDFTPETYAAYFEARKDRPQATLAAGNGDCLCGGYPFCDCIPFDEPETFDGAAQVAGYESFEAYVKEATKKAVENAADLKKQNWRGR